MPRDPEKVKAARKRWYEKHGKDYARKNKDKLLAAAKKYYINNRDKCLEKSKIYRKKDFAKLLFANARNRARTKNLEFTLTRPWLDAKLEPMCCEATGVKLVWDHEVCKPSLDKINPELGYTEDNTQITTWIYNRAKFTFSKDDMLKYLVRPMAERNMF